MTVAFRITTTSWSDDRTQATFRYELDVQGQTYYLKETLELPAPSKNSVEQERLLRSLHLALAISYYKVFLPPKITHPYTMTAVEASFWNTVYEHGLAEFIYNNQLSFEQIARFKEQAGVEITGSSSNEWKDEAILGLGGGKDSIVGGELLRSTSIPFKTFVLATGEQLGQTQAVADVMGTELLPIKRTLDPQIFTLNKLEGAINGHVPISLIFGLVGALIASNTNSKYVVVANEASSSIPQTTWEDRQINHQWSKSLEFERLFQDYLHSYISEHLTYFSAIRPLSSLGVSKIFTRFPDYFEVFTSDNSLFKINPETRDHPRWSLNSSKSLSSYILLSAWLNETELKHIFGRNFLHETSLKQSFLDMLGVDGASVLDCVGTPEELRLCLTLADNRGFHQTAPLMNVARERNLLGDLSRLEAYLQLQSNALPPAFENKIIDKIKEYLA